ncbi:hypothetical protein [Absidia glauca]|uniref:Uncharacterized protein n=1 Tax=Absidia glauca TaxID=4829 RepID=A0A168Q8S9_ABSGL|nr:hypothetical protein [Absidia glauca]
MTNTIHDFTPAQQKNVDRFCRDFYTKDKTHLLVNAVLHRGKKWWSYGVVAIVAHLYTGHGLWTFTTPWLTKIPTASTPVFLVELTVWSMGLGIAWYAWLSHLYGSQVNERIRKLAGDIDQAHRQPHTNVWLMKDTKSTRVLGVVILNCDGGAEEGQIKVAAMGSRIELALVQRAIQFARQQGIKVVTQEHWNTGPTPLL